MIMVLWVVELSRAREGMRLRPPTIEYAASSELRSYRSRFETGVRAFRRGLRSNVARNGYCQSSYSARGGFADLLDMETRVGIVKQVSAE